jgi:HPt (histidine-containing phosphotransfer) domain-containing protein
MSNSVDFARFQSETGLDDPSLKELYEGFLQELLEEKDKLLRQLSGKDYTNLHKTVHNIKGISGSYMAMNVFDRSSELNARLKAERTEELGVWVNILVNDIIEAAGEIISFCRK